MMYHLQSTDVLKTISQMLQIVEFCLFSPHACFFSLHLFNIFSIAHFADRYAICEKLFELN